MNREFEFRAWHKKKNHMYHNIAIGIDNKIGYRMSPGAKNGRYVYEDSKEVIVSPYIGARAKGSMRIYIGDILKVGKTKKLGIVVWDKEKLCYKLESSGGRVINGLEDPKKRSTMEVVGNIYENIDLL